MKWHCPICGEPTNRPLEATWWHFRPIESRKIWKGAIKGTYDQFGFIASATLLSPLLNTALNWKYRKSRLETHNKTI